jgi:hypothetical protein
MTDAYITRLGEALNALRDDLDRGGEYPDAEWRAARKFNVKPKDLREAYDEFTSTTHNPEEYL